MVSNEDKSRTTNEIPKNRRASKRHMQENMKIWGLYKQAF